MSGGGAGNQLKNPKKETGPITAFQMREEKGVELWPSFSGEKPGHKIEKRESKQPKERQRYGHRGHLVDYRKNPGTDRFLKIPSVSPEDEGSNKDWWYKPKKGGPRQGTRDKMNRIGPLTNAGKRRFRGWEGRVSTRKRRTGGAS